MKKKKKIETKRKTTNRQSGTVQLSSDLVWNRCRNDMGKYPVRWEAKRRGEYGEKEREEE